MPVPFDLELLRYSIVHCFLPYNNDPFIPSQVSTEVESRFKDLDSAIRITQSIRVLEKGQNYDVLWLEFTLCCDFSFEGKDLFWDESTAKAENSVINLLKSLMAGITASTARGLLMQKVVGTALKDWFLPILDPLSMFEHSAPVVVADSKERGGDEQ